MYRREGVCSGNFFEKLTRKYRIEEGEMIALEVASHAGKYINLQEQFFCEVYYSQKRDCFQKLSWRFDIRHSRNKQLRLFTQLSEAHVSSKLCIYWKKCILDVPVLSHCCIYWNACFRTFIRHPRFHLTW